MEEAKCAGDEVKFNREGDIFIKGNLPSGSEKLKKMLRLYSHDLKNLLADGAIIPDEFIIEMDSKLAEVIQEVVSIFGEGTKVSTDGFIILPSEKFGYDHDTGERIFVDKKYSPEEAKRLLKTYSQRLKDLIQK